MASPNSELRLTSRYSSLKSCILDLEKSGQLIRIKDLVDPDLEMAEIQRQVYAQNGPALLFENVKGSKFPCLANLFGSDERVNYIFRDTVKLVEMAIKLRTDPPKFLKSMAKELWTDPLTYMKLPFTGLSSLPRETRSGPVMMHETTIDQLPQIKCWPMDGGPFITLPQVFSLEPNERSIMKSNLGMYRVQLAGNDYKTNEEIGLHYQIHRGIGVHHQKALAAGKDLPVSIFIGGPPAHTFAAVMPLPEGLSELVFAGMLSGRRFRYSRVGDHIVSADADFCITGWIRGTNTKREGPFGDHLGYYSLEHEFPVMEVHKVYHRQDAIWPFTVVGRPPQEDTHFGSFIHRLTGDIVSYEIPGVKALHAVDASGVHPLLLAIGSERYTPYRDEAPKELLTQANAIFGFNQCSLAKYLFLSDEPRGQKLDIHNVRSFIQNMLSRADFSRDLHFQTKTTIDTLDYSGESLNYGSKLALVVNGDNKRQLSSEIAPCLKEQSWIKGVKLIDKGIVALEIAPFSDYQQESAKIKDYLATLAAKNLEDTALLILCDDAEFLAASYNNFLWATFTRSNPSHDIYGVEEFNEFKHWGCNGPLVIDARTKPHHAPELIEDKKVVDRVEQIVKSIRVGEKI